MAKKKGTKKKSGGRRKKAAAPEREAQVDDKAATRDEAYAIALARGLNPDWKMFREDEDHIHFNFVTHSPDGKLQLGYEIRKDRPRIAAMAEEAAAEEAGEG